jgi:myosin heavy subunit
MSDSFKYCLLKYGDLSSEEEKKLRSVFPKLIKYDPVVHTKSPLQIGDYDILSLNIKPGLFGGDSDGFKYFKANRWDEFIIIYSYESRKNVDYIVNAQFKVRNLPLNFTGKDDFINCVLDTSNNDSDLIAREPKTPAPAKQPVVSSDVVIPSLNTVSESEDKATDAKSADARPVDDKPSDVKPSDNKPTQAPASEKLPLDKLDVKSSASQQSTSQPQSTPQQAPSQQNSLIDSLNKLSSDYEKSVSDVTELKRKILGLESEVARLTSEKQSLSSKVELFSELEVELAKVKKDLVLYEKKLPELEDVAKRYEAEKNKTALLATQIADHASVKAELQKLKDEHSQNLASLSAKTDEVKQLNADKADLQTKFTAQQEETKKVFQVLVTLRDNHTALTAENSKIKELEAQRVTEIVKLRSENLKLKSELELVKEQLKLSKSACSEEENKAAALQSKISQLTQNINSLQSNLAKSSENSSASANVSKVEAASSSSASNASSKPEVNQTFRGSAPQPLAPQQTQQLASAQKEQKPDSAPQAAAPAVQSAATNTPANDAAKEPSQQAGSAVAKAPEVKAVADVAASVKKIKDLPQSMVDCKLMTNDKTRVVVEYFDIQSWSRQQKIYPCNGATEYYNKIREGMLFLRQRQLDIKQEYLK